MSDKIEIGTLNKRIIIQNTIDGTDAQGYPTKTPIQFRKCWSGVSSLSGREFYSAMAVQAENTLKFTIRYCKGLTTDMQILFGKKIVDGIEVDVVYNITSTDDINFKHEFIIIKALVIAHE